MDGNEYLMFCIGKAVAKFGKGNDYQGPLLLTWFNINPSMDK